MGLVLVGVLVGLTSVLRSSLPLKVVTCNVIMFLPPSWPGSIRVRLGALGFVLWVFLKIFPFSDAPHLAARPSLTLEIVREHQVV